jgi:hypothetical protein
LSLFEALPANDRFGGFRTFQSTCSNGTQELKPPADPARFSWVSATYWGCSPAVRFGPWRLQNPKRSADRRRASDRSSLSFIYYIFTVPRLKLPARGQGMTMMLHRSLLALALVCGSTVTLAAPPPGKLVPGAAQADYLINIYNSDNNMLQQGSKLGTHAVKISHSAAAVKITKGPVPAVVSRVIAKDGAQGSAQGNLSYDYVFKAKSEAAFADLTAYAASHDGTIAAIKGFAQLKVVGSGYALVSANGGATTIASYVCTDFGGDCNGPRPLTAKFIFTIPGAVTISDTVDRSFMGHISLSASANAFGPKSTVFAFIDPEITLPDDFGGSANDFTLDLSEGVTNILGTGNSNVPEPASWAMLIAGFGLTGAVMRRRRHRLNWAGVPM